MILQPQYEDIHRYLEVSDIIDFGNGISELSFEIASRSETKLDYIRKSFEFVRDQISHSADIEGRVVTCRASDVLQAKEGICYAKSHLLAAILRCNRIPTGFCYQRIMLDDESAPYLVLHGLNAVYIEELDTWIRLDARGNKPGVNAQFSLEDEKLAFPIRVEKGEEDISVIFAESDESVIQALTVNKDFERLWANLPTSLMLAY